MDVQITYKYKRLAVAFFVLFVLLNLFTLHISPLPWYDEVDFASISKSYSDTGRFICTVNDLYFNQPNTEVLYYGPVYFVLNSIIFKFFGFGMVQNRILNFIAGLICIYLFTSICKKIQPLAKRNYIYFFLPLLLITDYTFLLDMRSGRMDLVALAFVLAGMLLLLKANLGYTKFLLAGMFVALGLLTSPRVYFVVIAIVIYFSLQAYKTKNLQLVKGGLLAALSIVGFYFLWVIKAFGNFNAYIEYINQEICYFKNAQDGFFLPNYNLPFFQNLLFILAALICIVGIIINFKRVFSIPFFFLLSAVLFFYFFVGGPVINLPISMIVGFIYMLILSIISEFKIAVYLLAGMLLLNISFVSYKYFYLFPEYQQRSPAVIHQWIKERIPPKSKVVADDKYFYAIINSGSGFQYFQRSCDNKIRVNYQQQKWKADFLLVEDTTTDVFKDYRKTVDLVFLDRFNIRKVSSNRNFISSYDGYLFEFIYNK